MSYLNSVPRAAGADLSATQYKAVTVGGTIATTAVLALGIQQNKPAAVGRDLTVGYSGRSRFVGGAATIAAGALLTVANSGYMVTATSGDGIVGRNLNAVNSGGIGEGIFDFANPGTIL